MTIYANGETGDNNAPGTAARPVRSLGRAIAMSRPGDTIVAAGVFEPAKVDVSRLTLIGEGATIRGGAAPGPGLLIFSSRVTISGFTVEGADGGGIAGARGADFLTIRDNTIRHNRGNGVSLIGSSGHLVAGNRILNNIGTRDRHSSGISILHPRAVASDAAYQIKVLGNLIRGNGTHAATDGFGMIADKWTKFNPVPFSGWALVADNTFARNWNSGFYAYHARNIVLRNNAFTGNGTDPRFPRAVDIGLNDAQHVRLLGNVATSDCPSLALLDDTSDVTMANNQFSGLAPWSRPL